MKIVSSFLLFLIISLNSGYTQVDIQAAIEQFVSNESLKSASISFCVVDLDSKKEIASYDKLRTMPSASTAKLFSTATAFEILGPNYRPKTRIYTDGTIDSNGVLNGNIWIRGGGDPTLGSKYFTDELTKRDFLRSWADSIMNLGIVKINGNIIADASEFGYNGAPNGWSWVDMGNYYGAGPSGLTIFDNLVEFNFSTSSVPGRKTTLVETQPFIENLTFHNYVESSKRSGDNSYIYGAPYSLDRFATGTLPTNQKSFIVKGSLPDPENQFAYEFAMTLDGVGIEIAGNRVNFRSTDQRGSNDFYKSKQLLFTHYGETIQNIANKTNEKSINLFAEHLICLIGYEKTGDGSTDSGLRILESYWSNRFNTTGLQVNDGSGLSRSNAISAQNYVDLLTKMYESKNRDSFMTSLPIAGESGTLRNICKGGAAHGKMHAKSGTMTRIKSYAGYIEGRSGKKYAFALTVNNHTCSTRYLVDQMEIVFNKIALL